MERFASTDLLPIKKFATGTFSTTQLALLKREQVVLVKTALHRPKVVDVRAVHRGHGQDESPAPKVLCTRPANPQLARKRVSFCETVVDEAGVSHGLASKLEFPSLLDLAQEVALLEQLGSHGPQLLGILSTPPCLVYDLWEGSLEDVHRVVGRRLSWRVVLTMLRSVGSAMEALHAHEISHELEQVLARSRASREEDFGLPLAPPKGRKLVLRLLSRQLLVALLGLVLGSPALGLNRLGCGQGRAQLLGLALALQATGFPSSAPASVGRQTLQVGLLGNCRPDQQTSHFFIGMS